MPPMCQYAATDGFANEWHLTHYGARAVGGTAMIVVEATAIAPEGRITPGDLGLWKDEHIAPLQQITTFLKLQGCIPAIQLGHAGRKASCHLPWKGGTYLNEEDGAWPIVAPSPIPFNEKATVPIEISVEEIKVFIQQFKEAAVRALKAGFEALEFHAAHGYLLQEFLSPISNRRTDEYGGSFENRVRLLLETVAAVKSVWPEELPLLVRISATEWTEGGWDLEESIQLSRLLKAEGIALIDCSSGGNIATAVIPAGPNYQVPLSHEIRKATGIATAAVGFITEALQAEEILQNNEADLIMVGRELLRNPYFALQAARDLKQDIAWPLQYLRAKI